MPQYHYCTDVETLGPSVVYTGLYCLYRHTAVPERECFADNMASKLAAVFPLGVHIQKSQNSTHFPTLLKGIGIQLLEYSEVSGTQHFAPRTGITCCLRSCMPCLDNTVNRPGVWC